MRTAIFIIIGFLMSAVASGAQERLSLKHEALRGAVRSISVERAGVTIQNKVFIEGPRDRRFETFDADGNKVSVLYFNSDGVPGVKLVYTAKHERRVIERTNFDPDGTVGSRHTFGYDEGGNVIESVYNDSRGTRSSRMVDEYDDKGHIVKETGYDANDKQFRTDEFKYKLDEKGNVIEKLAYYNSQYTSKTVYTYDAQGNVTEKSHLSTSGLPFQITFSHSDRQLLSKESYTYEFDSHGNWTRQFTSVWDVKANMFVPDEVVYRNIVYY
jgi:YD repeat-containing protein